MEQAASDAPKCISHKGISVFILIDNEELDLYVLNDEMNIVCQVNKAYKIKIRNDNDEAVLASPTIDGVPVSPYLRIIPPHSDTEFTGFYKDGGRAISEFVFSPIKKKENTIKGKMNTEIGIIEVKILNCIHKGRRQRNAVSALEDSLDSFHSVNKSVEAQFINPKKCGVVTGEGQVRRTGGVNFSDEIYESTDTRCVLRLRYNSIQVPVPKGELSENIDYE